MDVKFSDYSDQIKNAASEAVEKWLYESSELIKGDAANLSRVQTGQLRGSWDYDVDIADRSAEIGSPLQNAIWEEYGTGEYALNGDGRKGGWFYVDDNGNGHFTHGKRPHRTLFTAFNASKNAIINRAKQIIGGALK